MSSSNDLITANDILADVLVTVNDTEYKNGLPRGWYIRQIAVALEELGKESFFQVRTQDEPFPDNLILPLPSNCFNVKEIYLYTGACGEPESSRPVYYKRNFNNTHGGTNYTARRKETMVEDPYLTQGGESDMYYCNIENGAIMFGSNCLSYPYVRVVYYGMGGEIGEEPIIPRMFRQAIIDHVSTKVFQVFMTRDRSFVSLYQTAVLQRDGNGRNPGSWTKALRAAKKMDVWKRDNINEYMSRGNS